MKTFAFASRNNKEILRDPLNLAFGIGFPVVMLFLFSAIQANAPVDLFNINKITPGITVFGLSFISLFSGMLLAKDRSASFLMRLFASPLYSSDFILGYALPLLPMALAQSSICFIVAIFLGLTVTVNLLTALIVLIPSAILFIAFGLLAGTLLNDKQVGGICGALLTNVCALTGGAWFDPSLVGGTYKAIAYALPFIHSTEATKAALAGNYTSVFPHLWWVIGYALAVMVIAIALFNRKMNCDNT
jgi:ABC-2 type transport system permease protein